MKKILAVLLLIGMFALIGCAGINSGAAINTATDIAFIGVIQNNPAYKPAVVEGLMAIKVFLSGRVTYDDLLLEITKRFPGQYAYVGTILTGYIQSDKPVSETFLPLLGSYKEAVVSKIDRLIVLAGNI